MNRCHFVYGAGAAIAVAAAACASHTQAQRENVSTHGLKDLSPCSNRLVGAWIDKWQIQDSRWLPVILKNFNLITLGKLKWGILRPNAATYNFEEIDWMVAYCSANGIALHGHNLCWNASNPLWLENTLTPANADKILTENITTIMKRYAGKISSYDVVNEPIASWMGRADGLYTGPWLTALGPKYIDIAFHAAAAADPKALRVLNIEHVEEGNGDDKARTLTLHLIESLLNRGVPVQAIGFESHLSGDVSMLDTPSRNYFIKQVRQLGLRILITEMDIDDTRLPIDSNQNDADVSQAYSDYLTSLLSRADPKRLIFFTPGDLNNWYDRKAPDRAYARRGGALHRPGLFDSGLAPKPSYAAVAAALKATCR